MNKLLVYFALILFFAAGCGTIIRRDTEESHVSKKKEEEEEQEEKDETIAIEVFFPLPPLKLQNYPYDINGFPHKSHENRTDNLLFLLISY